MNRALSIIPLAFLLLLLTITSCESIDVKGSGNIISEERTVADFSGVAATGNLNIIIEYGGAQQLTITADDNVIEYIQTDVNGSILNLYLNDGDYSQITTDVLIKLPVLERLEQSGSVVSAVTGFQNLDQLILNSSGSSVINCFGSCSELEVSSSGSSTINAFDLNATNCSVSLTESSLANLQVSNALNGQISGSSVLNYKGQPSINVATNGSAQINDAN